MLTQTSPNDSINLMFFLYNGIPYYNVIKNGNDTILVKSRMGFKTKSGLNLANSMEVINSVMDSKDEVWEQPWGETKHVRNNYNELLVSLGREHETILRIRFRVFNEGVGFRYEFPENKAYDTLTITKELTEYAFTENEAAWWIPAYKRERYEYLYQKNNINDLDTIHTPVTLETSSGNYICLHEASLVNFPSYVLSNQKANTLQVDLVPWKNGDAAYVKALWQSSWRTIQIAGWAGDLVTNYMILNLNEPNKIEDVSWVKPAKYMGIWWGMHIDKNTWGSGPTHGATTRNAKKYIDFAAENNIQGVLVEGWNSGWDGNWIENGAIFSFTQSYPDYNLEEVVKYAKQKNVSLVMHNETSAHIENYESQMEEAYERYENLGINYIKTGYVGSQLFNGEWHHGQYGVRHYQKTVELAAMHNIMLDIHEPIKATGLRRTWPNLMTREGARGMEYSAWSPDGGNPPSHVPTLVFTRFLAGPMDFTPGIFDLDIPSKPQNRINSTLAKQLAYYVIIYSPLQMAADLPENYQGNPAFQFIRDVPCDWDTTVVLNAGIGEYVTLARKQRGSDNWFLGSITDENERKFDVVLDFLDKEELYQATIYADGAGAHWKTNPYPISIENKVMQAGDTLHVELAPGGGGAIFFKKK